MGNCWKYVDGLDPSPVNVMLTSNSWRAAMAEAEAKEARWTRAEAMMEYFMAGRRIEGLFCYLIRTRKEKDGVLVSVFLGTIGSVD